MTMTTFTHDTHDAPTSGGALIARLRNLLSRRKLAPLMTFDDHMLADLGITRDDVRHARNLPLSQDAGVELHRVMLSRRRNR